MTFKITLRNRNHFSGKQPKKTLGATEICLSETVFLCFLFVACALHHLHLLAGAALTSQPRHQKFLSVDLSAPAGRELLRLRLRFFTAA